MTYNTTSDMLKKKLVTCLHISLGESFSLYIATIIFLQHLFKYYEPKVFIYIF